MSVLDRLGAILIAQPKAKQEMIAPRKRRMSRRIVRLELDSFSLLFDRLIVAVGEIKIPSEDGDSLLGERIDLGRIKASGFVAWLMWLFTHIFWLIGFRNRVVVFTEWAWAYVTMQRRVRLITGERLWPGSD